MINVLTLSDSDVLLQIPNDFIGTKIKASLIAYGTDFPFCSFWAQTKNNKPTAFILKFEQTVFLSTLSNADYDELCEFLNVIGFRHLQTEAGARVGINTLPSKEYNIMRFRQNNNQINCKEDITAKFDPDLKNVYNILFFAKNRDLSYYDFNAWYADVSHRIRHGTAAAAIYNNHSAIIASHIASDSAVISGISTMPQFKNSGMGSIVLKQMCLYLNKRNIFAACSNGIMPFYVKNGFEKINDLFIY